MKRWLLVPLLSASFLPFSAASAQTDDLNARAAQVKSQLQTQWLPAWAKISTANETAENAALNLQTLSYAHRMGYSTQSLNLLEAASAHYKLLRDSRRDKTNEGFYLRPQDSKEPTKSALLQAQVVEGLVEYARASGEAEPRVIAIKTWRLLRDKARDKVSGGYYDSLYSVQATPTSATAFGSKSALTHLALLEAGTGLYELTHDRSIRTDLVELLDLVEGRFFPVRTENRVLVFSPEWKIEQPAQGDNTAANSEAAVAIIRAQKVLGKNMGWVQFTQRVDAEKVSPNPAEVEALTSLIQVVYDRNRRAAQLDTALDGLDTNSGSASVANGLALIDFAAAFGK